jgi:hypothetical protein
LSRPRKINSVQTVSHFELYGQNLLPLTILPEEPAIRPSTADFLLYQSGSTSGLETLPRQNLIFVKQLHRNLNVSAWNPAQAWAGHYDDHPADHTPFVERLDGAIVVGGTSGSGIMKADSLGRVVAGLYSGLDVVQLGDDQSLSVASLALKNRAIAPERFIIRSEGYLLLQGPYWRNYLCSHRFGESLLIFS